MNAKKAKKFRKEVRRRVDQNFGVGLQALNHIIRPRPKWIPKRLWIIVYMPLFKKKYRDLILKHIA